MEYVMEETRRLLPKATDFEEMVNFFVIDIILIH